jgi:hypothetical protein
MDLFNEGVAHFVERDESKDVGSPLKGPRPSVLTFITLTYEHPLPSFCAPA